MAFPERARTAECGEVRTTMLPPPLEQPISQMRLRAVSDDALEAEPAEEIESFGDGRPTDVDELCWGATAELGA